MAVSKAQLEEIRGLIKAGKAKQALPKLAALIERDPDNPELWWLLANASDDPVQAKMAADQLLALKPDDPRAQKLVKRLDTRQLLQQMGVKRDAAVNSHGRTLFFMGFAAVAVLAVLIVVLIATSRPQENTVVADLPTQLMLPTLTATHTATVPPPTEAPTLPPAEAFDPAPEITAEITAEAMPENAFARMPDIQPEVTVDFSAPDFDFGSENTSAGAFTRPPQMATQSLEPFPELTMEPQPMSRLMFDPEVTQDPFAFDPNVTGRSFDPLGVDMSAVIPATPTPMPALNRGVISDIKPAQEIIRPYAEHAWTFSGYRGERIRIEVLNITGSGNPSLELYNPRGESIASDVDVVSGSNRDAVIELALPEDGIYKVVVRMAALKEQLYYLSLTRPTP